MLFILSLKNIIVQLRLLILSIIFTAKGLVVRLGSIIASSKHRLFVNDGHTPSRGQTTRDFIFIWRSLQELKKSTNSTTLNTSEGLSFVELSPLYNSVPSSSTLTTLELPSANNSTTTIMRNDLYLWLTNITNRSFGFGFYYIQGFVFVLFIDACLTDDEPLWEPIEWSLVQTWILFIFTFAWIAENLIVSRYGSYTGRDKRVWMSWYKTFWLIEGYYVINYGAAIVFVIIPFYFETNYNLSFVYSWWHWYSRVFFFKYMSILSLILYIAYFLQISVRWINWRKGLFLIILVNIFLSYLIYTQFIITFLGFFTDPVWYQKTRPIDYIQLSHEPAKWGWGSAKKDHFTYHNVKTVFWFKNDGPFAAAMLMFQTFLFVCIFFLYIYWITLFRRVYAMKEIPLTLTTYCVSSLKQFFYFSFFMYLMVFMSYFANYSRLPIEFLWSLDSISWAGNFKNIVLDYPAFIASIFF
jgi:hypothetical protein